MDTVGGSWPDSNTSVEQLLNDAKYRYYRYWSINLLNTAAGAPAAKTESAVLQYGTRYR